MKRNYGGTIVPFCILQVSFLTVWGISGRSLSGNGGESSVKIGGAGKTALLRNFQFTQGGGSQQTDGQLYPFDGDILPGGDTVEFFEQGREVGWSQVGYISKLFQGDGVA